MTFEQESLIVRLAAQGASYGAISIKVGVDYKEVRDVLRRLEKPKEQGNVEQGAVSPTVTARANLARLYRRA